MSERSYEKSPGEIEDEIARARADMDVTLDAIQRKLSPGELMDQALTYVKQNGGDDIMNSVGNLVRDNPVPVALVGAGLAWLIYAAARPQHDEERYDRGPQSGLGQGAYGTAYGTGDEARSNGSGLSGRARQAADAVSETASGVIGGARAYAAEAGERIGGVFGRMRDGGDYARGGWERARSGYSSIATDRPLVLGAIGFAAGAAIGLAIPSTRKEDEVLGDYRDQLFEQAQAAGREQVQKAQTVANEAWRAAKDTVKEEAGKQGFASTTETGGEKKPAGAAPTV